MGISDDTGIPIAECGPRVAGAYPTQQKLEEESKWGPLVLRTIKIEAMENGFTLVLDSSHYAVKSKKYFVQDALRLARHVEKFLTFIAFDDREEF